MRTRSDKSGSPSVAVLSVLFALGDQDLHGYGIIKEVEARTAGRVKLLPSSLYATIKRMLGEGWITEVAGSEGPPTPGRAKRHYRITDEGRELASREMERLSALLDMARTNRIAPLEPTPDSGASS